ncbi:MAG: shikimate kinase [archaeon]
MIALIGFKGCGKTSIGKELAKIRGMRFIDLDRVIEDRYEAAEGESLSCRQIYMKKDKKYFRNCEKSALNSISGENVVLSTGGGTPVDNGLALKSMARVIYLKVDSDTLYRRIMAKGMPAFFDGNDPRGSFERLLAEREPVYEGIADVTVDVSGLTKAQAAKQVAGK